MAQRIIFVAMALLLIASKGASQESPEMGNYAVIVVAREIDQKGNLRLRPDAGNAAEEKRRASSIPLADALIFDTEGTQLSLDDARKIIRERSSVLLVHTGKRLSSEHLQIVKKGTLVFYLPQQHACLLSGDIRQILTNEKYEKIRVGMTLKEVYAVLDMGANNEKLGPRPTDLDPDTTWRISWLDEYGRGIIVTLQGDKVIGKSQRELDAIDR